MKEITKKLIEHKFDPEHDIAFRVSEFKDAFSLTMILRSLLA